MKYLAKTNELYHRLLYQMSMKPKDMQLFMQLNFLDQRILNIVFENENISISKVAKILGISKSTMTSAVNRLEKCKIIERVDSIVDKRVSNIKLTSKGIMMQKHHHQFEDFVFRKILNVLDSDDEAEKFLNSLEKILCVFEFENGSYL